MALSTTIPIAKIKPNKEIMFIDMPRLDIIIKVAVKDMPIPNADQNARRISRNNARHKTTRTRPIAALFTKRSIRSCKFVASFCQTVTSIPSSRVGRNFKSR